MRLIDADELQRMTQDPTMYAINVSDTLSLIDDCPTAYDVDAVVKELEKLRDADVDECTEYCFIKAIDVVKRGGRNE